MGKLCLRKMGRPSVPLAWTAVVATACSGGSLSSFKPKMILSSLTAGPVSLTEESGHGLPGCYRCGIGIADFDGDGRIDLVMAGAFDSAWMPGMQDYTYQNVVRVYRNVSVAGQEIQFELQEEMSDVRAGGGAMVKVGDFNGDGLPDFAVQFRDGGSPQADNSAFMNEGNWSFTRRIIAAGFNAHSTSMGMEVADVDQDGLDDLIFNSDGYDSSRGLWYKWTPATSSWEAQQSNFSHRITYGGTLSAGDLDGDGYPDIVVGGNARLPFGTHDCASTLMFGETHLNMGANANPRGIMPDSFNTLGAFSLRSDRANPRPCTGWDNAGTLIADVDNDGTNDIIISGSADGFSGPPGMNGVHYGFIVLRNVDGTGNNFQTFENAGHQLPNGTTNGGSGSVDSPNIAIGDLDGDGFPEIFVQGHHRDYENDPTRYVFQSRLFLNQGGTGFQELDLGLSNVSEGGQAMADFNNDGRIDLIFTGASIPFHTNGSNPTDQNDRTTLRTHVYRNSR